MKIRLIFTLLCGILILGGCSDNPILPTESQIVVQAFLYNDQAVADVYVGMSYSLGSTDSTNQPVNTADISLIKDGITYRLSLDRSREGYYFYPGTDLVVTTGDQFSLHVTVDATSATAETTVPAKPVDVSITQPAITFTIDTISSPMGTRERISLSDSVSIRWSNPTNDYYYVVVKSIDSSRTAVFSDSVVRFPSRMYISSPTTGDNYQLNENQLQYTGKYRAYVYHVNKEYADLYRTREQNSRTLTEPLTNIKNGLGVFSAFSTDSVSFTVDKQ
jgi:hypothetical protein